MPCVHDGGDCGHGGAQQAGGEGTVYGFKLTINPQLIEDIVQDSGLTRRCATAGVKGRVVDETPLEEEEESYF